MDGQRKYTIAGIAAAVLGAVAVMIFVYACLLAGNFEKKYIISAGVLSFLVIYPLTSWFFTHKQSENEGRTHWYEKLFLILCGGIVLLPICHMDSRDSDKNENRTLAKAPVLFANGKLNENFGKQAESWLNDRFWGRKYYLSVYDSINKWFGIYDTDMVLVGQEDWLFYKGDHSMALYQHAAPFKDEELQRIDRNLRSRKAWMESQGILYSVLIATNKADVYGEFYNPDVVQKNTPDRVNKLLDYLEKEQNPVTITYPLELLLSHKNEGLLYLKNDTHWSCHGAYYGYWLWMQNLKKDIPDLGILALDDMEMVPTRHGKGDLQNMLKADPAKWEEYIYYEPKMKGDWPFTYESKKDGNGGIIHTLCPGKNHVVIVFRDSFTSALIPYIASTFGEVYFIWSHDYDKYTDLILSSKADIVLDESVSRFTSNLLRDVRTWEVK